MRSKSGSVTSFDVARLAGVTQPTVSRAMRGLPSVSPATRDKVLAAARELRYLPSDSARALSTRSSKRVAVVSEELTNPYYPQLVEPLRAQLDRQGYRTVLVTDAASSKVSLDGLADGSYDGVVLSTTRRRDTLPRDLSERGVPHVMLNRVLDHPQSASCAVDNEAGARQVVSLLLNLGHHDIASLQGPVDTSTGRERGAAVSAAMRAGGLRSQRALNRRVPFEHDAAFAAACEVLTREPRPTAVVCGNDVIALGVLSAARHLGLSVPDDLSVVGFDDIPMAGWPLVSLTTVRCDLALLATTAVDLLIHAMTADPVEQAGQSAEVPCIRLKPDMVLRGTHAPPNHSS